jgi:hypothetical protein
MFFVEAGAENPVAAVLVAMNAWVYTVERQKDLFDFSQKKLRELHLRPKFQSFGDGFVRLDQGQPYSFVFFEQNTNMIRIHKAAGELSLLVVIDAPQMLFVSIGGATIFQYDSLGRTKAIFIDLLHSGERAVVTQNHVTDDNLIHTLPARAGTYLGVSRLALAFTI